MRRLLLNLLKFGISVSIIAYLVIDARGNEVFTNLRDQPKNWGFLALAWGLCATAVGLTLVRWHYLVRALELPFGLKDAFRLGFLGYLFNLAPMGIVGGDLLKAVMLAREQKRNRAKAVASVIVDRLIGLYLLFVVASAAIGMTGFWRLPVPEIRVTCKVTLLLTALGAVGIAILLAPALTEGRLARALGRVPRIGRHIDDLIEAVRMYRRKPQVLLGASLMSIGVHSLFATGVYCIARGLPGDVLSLGTHFVVMPLSAVTGVLPLPMGPFEWVLETLYLSVPASAGVVIVKGQGLVVALAYRIITVLIAAVGVCYYLSSRQEVAEVMHEVQREQEADREPVVEIVGGGV